MVSAIVAVDKNWGLGKNGKRLLSIPEDVKFFREITSGNTVIMGRKTFESFYQGKPLPNRINIVVTSDMDFKTDGVLAAHSPEEAMKLAAASGKDAYIVGGGQVYAEMLRFCDEIHVTYIDYKYEADAFFPNLDKLPEWVLVAESDEQTNFDIIYFFRKYQRRADYRP